MVVNVAKVLLNLKTAVGSRKSAQPLDTPRKFKNWLITQKVTTPVLNFLCTSIASTAFSRPTAVFRFIGGPYRDRTCGPLIKS